MALTDRGRSALRRGSMVGRQLGAARLMVTIFFLVLALLLARFGWKIPLAIDAERALYDIRAAVTAPRVDQDSRIAMVVYTDETLAATGKRSPLDRTMLANALKALDTMGVKSIGIDILIDQKQPEDQVLIDAFKTLKTPTYLAFASNKTNKTNIQPWQEAFLADFQRRIAQPKVKAASVFFQADTDGAMRSWPVQPRFLPPLLPNAMTQAPDATRDYHGAIAYRLPRADSDVILSMPIDNFINPEIAVAMAPLMAGRHVLIGGDIVDQDLFSTPLGWLTGDPDTGAKKMIGLEVHAQMLAQLLDGRWLEPIGSTSLWLFALLVLVFGALTALSNLPPILMGLLLIGEFGLFIGLPFLLQWHGVDTVGLPAFGWAIGWIASYSAVGTAARVVGSEQRRFAQSALGKYLPRDIAAEILRDPDGLKLHGEKREIFVVFTDLEGFTKLSHAIEPEMVATLLNTYLETLSNIVLDHGGTIDKFVGDAVVAFWGAPISRPDDGARAAQAGWAMYEAGEVFRRNVPDGVPAIGRTRVGLHHGEAIVGNFGGEGRIQYTALGDSMNTAARLESANKQLKSKMLVSREAVERSGLDWFRPLGRVVLRGRATPLDVFEPIPAMPPEKRAEFADMVARATKGDAQAIDELDHFSEMHPEDAAARNLVYRVTNPSDGGYFVLD